MPGLLYKTVAVAAIKAYLASVRDVGKRYRLIRLVAHPGVFLSGIIIHSGTDAAANENKGNQQLEWERISPAWEDISHRILQMRMEKLGACEKFHKQKDEII